MNTHKETLIKMLHSVTEYDVIEIESDGKVNYAIRNLAPKPSLLLLDELNIKDFPQWVSRTND